MQLSCPFCGKRNEGEFFYAVEAGKIRPDPARQASAEQWAGYLYFQENLKGLSREIWLHFICGEYFEVTRDTVTHEVVATVNLP
jgi:heterotetrameric sarcosine oxidase delta subunit